MIFELRGDDRDGTKAVASSEYRERGVRNDSVVYGISERQGKERGTFSGGRFRGGGCKIGIYVKITSLRNDKRKWTRNKQ